MNSRILKFAACIALSLGMGTIVACGSDSGSNAEEVKSSASTSQNTADDKSSDVEDGMTVETEDDMPKCTTKREGFTVFVEENDGAYVCEDFEWVKKDVDPTSSSDDVPDSGSSDSRSDYVMTVETEDDLPKCTALREGKIAYVTDEDAYYACEQLDWVQKDNFPIDDAFPVTMADQCSKGISEDCLVGTWQLESISSLDGSEKFTVFANPGKLVINDDATFAYTFSIDGTDECAGATVKGMWEIVDKTTFKFRVTNGDCIEPSASFTPEITVEGNVPMMSIQKLIFQQGYKDATNAGNESEVFSRIL